MKFRPLQDRVLIRRKGRSTHSRLAVTDKLRSYTARSKPFA
jgi:co-chaperonin GroES (HSP10)